MHHTKKIMPKHIPKYKKANTVLKINKKKTVTFSIRQKVINQYEKLVNDLNLDRNETTEQMLINFIKDIKNASRH